MKLQSTVARRPKVVSPRLLQVAACVNAVRQDPDGFACEYPCTYADWRDDVISPARGALTASGTTGAEDLDA